jgi:hypothetical protein
VLIGDGGFAAASLGHTCRHLRVRFVSRMLLSAQLSDPVQPQPKGRPGVKPNTGPRQRKLTHWLKDAATAWLSQEIPWYAGQQLKMDVLTGEALWHRDGEAPLPVRWVLLRDPSGKRSPFALLCTDPTIAMLQIISWYVSRWNIEVTFEEARAHLGNVAKKVSPRFSGWSTRRKIRTFGSTQGVSPAWSSVSRVALQASRARCEIIPLACQKYRVCGGVTQQEQRDTEKLALQAHSVQLEGEEVNGCHVNGRFRSIGPSGAT